MVDVTSLRTPEKKKKKRRRPRRGAKVASRRMALQVQVCNLDIEGPCVHRVHVDMRVSCYFSSIAFSGETQSAVKTSTFSGRIRAHIPYGANLRNRLFTILSRSFPHVPMPVSSLSLARPALVPPTRSQHGVRRTR